MFSCCLRFLRQINGAARVLVPRERLMLGAGRNISVPHPSPSVPQLICKCPSVQHSSSLLIAVLASITPLLVVGSKIYSGGFFSVSGSAVMGAHACVCACV